MDREAYERELTSRLLSELYGSSISSEQFAEGFQQSVDKLEDLQLDIPLAGEMFGKFLARAIVDEIVPPAFLKSVFAESKVAEESIALASGLVNDPHRSRKLEHIWGPGDLVSVKRLKQEVNKLLAEYITSGDKEEADRCVRKLNAPSFHFQLVRIALKTALGSTSEERKQILNLLAFFNKEGLIVPDHMTQGFKSLKDGLEDIKLDIPLAPSTFDGIVKDAQSAKWLSADFK